MIVYKVTIDIDYSVEEDWLLWMKNEHIPELIQLNLFLKTNFFKRLPLEKNPKNIYNSYCVEYYCTSIKEYNLYKNTYANKIQEKHSNRYKGKFKAKREILELINDK